MRANRRGPPPGGEGRIEVRDEFASELLGNARTVSVRLPPGYDIESARRYPVLYMHDGQNVFSDERSVYGKSWRAGEISDRLTLAGRMRPVIIVAIDNTPGRMDEYALYRDPTFAAGGRAEAYMRFVLDEVKPFVDRKYRTLPDRAHTATAGASMGGLVSLTMAMRHHDRISRCGVVSPSLWWCRARVLDDLEDEDTEWMAKVRFWLCMGTREGRRRAHVTPHIEYTRRLVDVFDGAGLLPGRDYCYWEVAGGEHDELAWRARLDKLLLYFYGW
jgi:predicted alpha/beta superfamily hydrolase